GRYATLRKLQMSKIYKGSCLCGGIRFSVSGFSEKAANCYCSMCRKFHGAAFGTLVGVRGLQWLSGEQLLKEFVASNGTIRTFCSDCGSSLGFRVKGSTHAEIELAISTFDDDIPVKIDSQIYTAYKASWCHLDPKLPAFAEGREG
uniref:GFA family protein n=1 Tax=Vibrio vulnificus TaxID=672 RepID=UPI002FBD9BC8